MFIRDTLNTIKQILIENKINKVNYCVLINFDLWYIFFNLKLCSSIYKSYDQHEKLFLYT
jgi:hypothetical protein